MPATNAVASSRSFYSFYLDDTLAGHAFLKPSIFVGKSCKHIFSPVKSKKCSAVLEIITRLVLFIILPILALLSAIFIPLGLMCKLCTAPTVSPPVKPETPRAPTPYPSPPETSPRPDTPYGSPRAQTPTLAEVQEATRLLDEVNKLLANVKLDNIQSQLGAAKKLLEDPRVKQLLLESQIDAFKKFSERYSLLEGMMRSLEYEYYFYSNNVSDKGEIKVKDDGNCLFAACALHSEMNDSVIPAPDNVKIFRQEIVKWISDNYKTDKGLQCELINSLAEHYGEKLTRLEKEQDGINDALAKGQVKTGEELEYCNTRLSEIPKKLKRLDEILLKVTQASGQAHSDLIYFEHVADLVPDYLVEMSQEKKHGGAAELYAYSICHSVCIKIYAKRGSQIDNVPYKTMNPDFEKLKPARLFTHSDNHYNPRLFVTQ